MDIAAMSVLMHQSDVQQQAGITVLKMAMGITETNGNSIVSQAAVTQSGGSASHPYLGNVIDIQA